MQSHANRVRTLYATLKDVRPECSAAGQSLCLGLALMPGCTGKQNNLHRNRVTNTLAHNWTTAVAGKPVGLVLSYVGPQMQQEQQPPAATIPTANQHRYLYTRQFTMQRMLCYCKAGNDQPASHTRGGIPLPPRGDISAMLARGFSLMLYTVRQAIQCEPSS